MYTTAVRTVVPRSDFLIRNRYLSRIGARVSIFELFYALIAIPSTKEHKKTDKFQEGIELSPLKYLLDIDISIESSSN